MNNGSFEKTDIIHSAPSYEKIKINRKPAYLFFKRTFDIVFSLLALIVGCPIMLLIALIIVIDSPGASPIYRQKRVGKKGKVFWFYKFRTMVAGADNMLDSLLDKNEMEGPAFKIKDDPRITRFGRFLRRTSIDEIPQFWNVLRGDMSIVGPRPPLPREVELYDEYQLQRLEVRPGLTCYWQVSPRRNDMPFDQWLALDFKYMEERSAKVDILLLFKTVAAICGQEGE
ncbi:MAG: sugar transferase [Clostridia bacterium]|nr:sugar transferase [Clostridia bacterium]